MKEVTIQEPHRLGTVEARRRVAGWQAHVERQHKVSVSWFPNGYTAALGGTVGGNVWVRETDVVVKLTLGTLAGLFSGQIEAGVRQHLQEALKG